MNSNDNARTAPEVVELGAASVETKGPAGITENLGFVPMDGISEA